MHSRRAAAALLLLSAAVLAGPSASAALNGPRAYGASYDYMPQLDAPLFTMASGRLTADLPSAAGTLGFLATRGAEVSGLTRVCWVQGTRQCADSPSGQLTLAVLDGGSFGLRFPDRSEARLEAEHALGLFVDLAGEADLNSLGLGKSLLAPMVGGTVTVQGISSIPTSATQDPSGDSAGLLAPTEAATTIQVYDGTLVRATLAGKGEPIAFAGEPVMAPVSAELAVVPFAGGADVARFTRASEAAARVGLDVGRINGLMDRLYSANEGAPTRSSPLDPDAFGAYADAAPALFGGAVLRLPTQQASGTDIAFARVSHVQVRGTPADGLAWSGRASLEIRDGHVAGAKDLAGFGLLQMPWWAWVLWFLGLGAWVARLVLKPARQNATWDPHKWIGWVAGPLAFLLALFLWDLETRAVLGLSLLSGDATGQVLLLVALLELGTFALASFAAIAPLRMLLRNGSLLLRQGTFMGLSGAAAHLVGFLFVATYLRAYLDLLVSSVLAGIA